MSTIRKTISISNKDKVLQDIINSVPNYEVSHVIRQLMYDGIKYRTLLKQNKINDLSVEIGLNYEESGQKPLETIENSTKREDLLEKVEEINDFEEEIDFNSIKLEEIDENDEDLEDILLKNS